MTPKQKAEELIRLFSSNCRECSGDDKARELALLCVGEIEQALIEYGRETDELQNMDSEFRWWDKVTAELVCNF